MVRTHLSMTQNQNVVSDSCSSRYWTFVGIFVSISFSVHEMNFTLCNMVYLVYTSFDCDPICMYVKRQMGRKKARRSKNMTYLMRTKKIFFQSHFELTERNNFSFCLVCVCVFFFCCCSSSLCFSFHIKWMFRNTIRVKGCERHKWLYSL